MSEEGIPVPEYLPTKAEVIERLKSEGLTEEAKALVIKWTEIQERGVKTARDGILLNIQRIDFYEAVGDLDGAWQCAQEAFENAYREGENDICEELQSRYPGIGA